MNKFFINSLVNEIYQEIIYSLYGFNYKDDLILNTKDINQLKEEDINRLNNSKEFKRLTKLFKDYLIKNNIYLIDSNTLDLLNDTITKDSLNKIMIDISKNIVSYRNDYKKIEEKTKSIFNQIKENNTIKDYPIYINVLEKECIIERIIVTLNSKSILYKSDVNFSFKTTTVKYSVPLQNYEYKGTKLLSLSKDEIFKILDKDIKVNLALATYIESESILIDKDSDYLVLPSDEIIKTKLLKEKESSGGLKSAIKDSLKRAILSIILIVILTLIIIFFKYLV